MPARYIGRQLEVRETKSEMQLFDGPRVVVTHPLRQLRRLIGEHPQTPLHLALNEAARYGLYDLERVKATVLRKIDGDFFSFDFDTEEE